MFIKEKLFLPEGGNHVFYEELQSANDYFVQTAKTLERKKPLP